MIKKTIPILLLSILIVGFQSEWAKADSSQETTPLQVLKNQLARVEDRMKAIDQLKTSNDVEMISALSQIIRDSEEPIILRAHIMEVLIQSGNQWASRELKKVLKDSSIPSENRILALYALWKKDAREMKSDLMNLAQNNNESPDMRVAALNYLRTEKDNKWPPRFWENIYLKKENPAPVRIQAMNGMKELGFITQPEIMIIPIIEDPYEQAELRKAVILIADSIVAQEVLQKALMSVLSKTENPLEMRRLALDNLALKPNETILPQLKQILSRESDPILVDGLKALITSAAPKKES